MRKKTFILDTNVILHDPNCLYQFDEHDIILPITVLEEIDVFKRGNEQINFHAREFIRTLDSLVTKEMVDKGVSLGQGKGKISIMLDQKMSPEVKENFPSENPDRHILNVAFVLRQLFPKKEYILVSKDTNLRLKALSIGIPSEDYLTDHVEESTLGYTGFSQVEHIPSETIDELYKERFVNREIINDLLSEKVYSNQFYIWKNGKKSGLTMYDSAKDGFSLIERLSAYGIQPKNAEQTFALNALLNDNIQLVTLEGKAGTGKSQPISEPVLTPNGWVPIGEIKAGDFVFSADGSKTKVLSTHPQGTLPIFNVWFSDGSSTRCSGDHLWETKTSQERDRHLSGKIRTTIEIKDSLTYGIQKKKNHSIPITNAVDFEEKSVLIDPYLLGILIGDGALSNKTPMISTADEEILDEIRSISGDALSIIHASRYDYRLSNKLGRGWTHKNPLDDALEHYGLKIKSDKKFIPNDYKFGSVSQREAILQGLMDSDGTLDYRTGKNISFTTTSQQLAMDISHIVQSLGGTAKTKSKRKMFSYNGESKIGKLAFCVRIVLPPEIAPFRLSRKINKYVPNTKYPPRRFIVDVSPIGEEECVCLFVDHESHLYLTKNFIVTHNTLLSLAASLERRRNYKQIFLARPIIALSNRDIGFLPGDIKDKLDPYMQPLWDNLAFIRDQFPDNDKQNTIINKMLEEKKLKIEPLAYIRGRSLHNVYFIVDEAQNLTPHEVKTIITRAGEGTKLVFTGDTNQIDHPYLDKRSNGLSYLIERFKGQGVFSHIRLMRGERSGLADLASELL